MPEEEAEKAIPMFCYVMGQIIASPEPLHMVALNMRLHFPDEDGRYKVEVVMGSLGSLAIGTADPNTLIRRFHSFFYDFLTEQRRSGKFIGTEEYCLCLAAAHRLCFNVGSTAAHNHRIGTPSIIYL